MSVANALKAARAAGIQLAIDGDDLVLEAPAPPSPAVLGLLKCHKPEIVKLLRRPAPTWTSADWQAFFDERAGILEHEQGMGRQDAERTAFDACVSEWMRRHPVPVSLPESGCVHCRTPETNTLLPALTQGGAAWVHDTCWRPWFAKLKAAAVAELAEFGIHEGDPNAPLARAVENPAKR